MLPLQFRESPFETTFAALDTRFSPAAGEQSGTDTALDVLAQRMDAPFYTTIIVRSGYWRWKESGPAERKGENEVR